MKIKNLILCNNKTIEILDETVKYKTLYITPAYLLKSCSSSHGLIYGYVIRIYTKMKNEHSL